MRNVLLLGTVEPGTHLTHEQLGIIWEQLDRIVRKGWGELTIEVRKHQVRFVRVHYSQDLSSLAMPAEGGNDAGRAETRLTRPSERENILPSPAPNS